MRQKLYKSFIILFSLFLLWTLGYIFFMALISQEIKRYPHTKTDAIIVVTGGAKRIGEGLDLLANQKADKLLISGVNQKVNLNKILSYWDGDKSKVECCITIEHLANNTYGNARQAEEWVRSNNIYSLRLVTASYHMPRTLLAFKKRLPQTLIVPHPVNAREKDKSTMLIGFNEYNKTLVTLFWYLVQK
jgi:uncharacterized SAM-binding protein YcdF (DUF218 family)